MFRYELVRAVGASGAAYEFQMYPLGTRFKELPGLYVFGRPVPNGQWEVLYVGQTHNLQSRIGTGLSTHHKILDARNLGATHIGVSVFIGREYDRLQAESDLIASVNPRLNTALPPKRRWI
jgi:excinuclease UvrABC nuclease subunit